MQNSIGQTVFVIHGGTLGGTIASDGIWESEEVVAVIQCWSVGGRMIHLTLDLLCRLLDKHAFRNLNLLRRES